MPGDIESRDSDFTLKGESNSVRFQPNHALMARPKPRERDLQPQRYFFYHRMTDDQMLCFTEAEAAMMMKSTHKFMLRYLGCSNGQAYAKSIRECGVKPGEVILKTKAQEILNAAFAAELEAAKGHYDQPEAQNVHFDAGFKMEQRNSFVPPA